MPIEGTMGIRHIDNIGHIGGLKYADMQKTIVVMMLGYLPLAIEQAAAYIREVTADFLAFLAEYERNHKKLYTWVPAGNRQYPNSIATTWSMSLKLLPKYAAKLLRLTSSFLILESRQYSNHVFGCWRRSFARRFTAYNIRSNRNGNSSAGTREILANQMGPSEEIGYYSWTCAGGR